MRSSSPDRFLFSQGHRVSDNVGVPVVTFSVPLSKLIHYSCLPNSSMLPLVNKDLGMLLTKVAPMDIQLVKAKVLVPDGESDDFFILNIMSTVTGIDKDQSIFSFVPGTKRIMSFKRLVHINDCLGEKMLARDTDYLWHILVSEVLVDILRINEINGVEFQLASEMNW